MTYWLTPKKKVVNKKCRSIRLARLLVELSFQNLLTPIRYAIKLLTVEPLKAGGMRKR